MKRTCRVGLSIFVLAISALAAAQKIESIGKFTGQAPDAVKAASADTGYRVTGADGKVLAEIWPAKSAASVKNDSSGALYPEFVTGAFYGIVAFPNGGGD